MNNKNQKLNKQPFQIFLQIIKILTYFLFYFVIVIVIAKLCYLQLEGIKYAADKYPLPKIFNVTKCKKILRMPALLLTIFSTLRSSTLVFNIYYSLRPLSKNLSLLLERIIVLLVFIALWKRYL